MKSCVMPVILCLLMVSLTSSTSSAYYKYITTDGTVCFVERLDMVPPRYRSTAIENRHTRGRSDKVSKQAESTTSAIQESGGHKVQDNSETSGSGFRWNFGVLVLLGASGFFIARRIEQRGFFKRASHFRSITLVLVVVLAYFFNKDIVDGCTEAIRLKVAATRKSIAEQREKDRKPLKRLSERVYELMQQPNQ
jgi:hypothetical protein